MHPDHRIKHQGAHGRLSSAGRIHRVTSTIVGLIMFIPGVGAIADVRFYEQMEEGDRVARGHTRAVYRRQGGTVVAVHAVEPVGQSCCAKQCVEALKFSNAQGKWIGESSLR